MSNKTKRVFVVIFCLVASPVLMAYAESGLPDLALQATARSHTEIASKTGHSYKIVASDETAVENESLQIEVLDGKVVTPAILAGGSVDFSSFESIVQKLTTNEMSDEEKALTLWRFVMENLYHGRWGTTFDGIEHLNVYGYGYCGTFTAVLEPLWWAAGLRARHINTGNHAATEVYYDNDWHFMDAHMRTFYLEKDNRTIASLEELDRDPDLKDMFRRQSSSKAGKTKYYYMTMHPEGQGGHPGYSRQFVMAKGDTLELTWKKSGQWCRYPGAEGGGRTAPEPPIYANGIFLFHREFSNARDYETGLEQSGNIDTRHLSSAYLHPARAGKDAYLVYRVKVPYFITSASVSGRFLRRHPRDEIMIDISTDDGVNWKTLWRADKLGAIDAAAITEQTQEVTTDRPWKYSYLIRVRMRAASSGQDVGVSLLRSRAHLVLNPLSLPALREGANLMTFRDDVSSAGTVKITHQWKEELPVRISRELPLEGQKVILSAKVSNLGTAPARRIPVVFYYGDPSGDGNEIGRDVIDELRPGETGTAEVSWEATRIILKKKNGITAGAEIFVSVDPGNTIPESDETNNISARLIKVLYPPQVSIPSASFITLEAKDGQSEALTIRATLRNFNGSLYYGYFISDHAAAENVKVRIFDGEPSKGMQIGSDRVVKRIRPLEFMNVAVDWDISGLQGVHKIYVQVFPPENLKEVDAANKPEVIATTVDLDAYRSCEKRN